MTGADLPGLDDPAAPFRIDCDIEAGESNITEDVARYSLSLTGAWWPQTPELSAATRTYPVIFEYPQADAISIDVTAPHGFRPRGTPAPIRVDSPYGHYQLAIAATPFGYRVERSFELTPLVVKPEDYATLKSFIDQVRRGDRTAIMFERSVEKP